MFRMQADPWLKSKLLRWPHLLGAVIAPVLAGLMMSADARSKTLIVRPLNYYNVDFKKLISTYKEAYKKAGFEFKTLTARPNPNKDRQEISTILVFEFPNPNHPQKKKGFVSVKIISPSRSKECAPCSIYKEIFSAGYFDEYGPAEWAELQSKITTADQKAAAHITKKLGVSNK